MQFAAYILQGNNPIKYTEKLNCNITLGLFNRHMHSASHRPATLKMQQSRSTDVIRPPGMSHSQSTYNQKCSAKPSYGASDPYNGYI